MADLSEMSRVLYCHNWQHIENWASAVDNLADLSDGEIAELQRLGAAQMPRNDAVASPAGGRFGLTVIASWIAKLRAPAPAPRLPARG